MAELASPEFINALLRAVQDQRNEALNKLAHSEANNAVLAAEFAKLQERSKDQAEKAEQKKPKNK